MASASWKSIAALVALCTVAGPGQSSEACPTAGDREEAFESSDRTLPTGGTFWQDGQLRSAGETRHVEVWLHDYDVGGACVPGAAVYLREDGSVPCPEPGRQGAAPGPVFFLDPVGFQTSPDGVLFANVTASDVALWRQNQEVGGTCVAGAGPTGRVDAAWAPCPGCLDPNRLP